MGTTFPPRDKSRQPLPVSNDWVKWRLKDANWVATTRARLQSLSWFMKCLKEPLSRLANRQDKGARGIFRGTIQERGDPGRGILLATCAYIDLNPVAAGIVEVPEASPHTSVTTRVEHVKAQGRTSDLKAAEQGSVAGSVASARAWRKQSGSARSKIDAGWIHHVKGCSKASRWAAICLWLITPAGCSAKAKP